MSKKFTILILFSENIKLMIKEKKENNFTGDQKLTNFLSLQTQYANYVDLTFLNAHLERKLHQRIPILLKNYISIEGLLYLLTILEKKN